MKHDCGTNAGAEGMIRGHVCGLIVGLDKKQKQERKSNSRLTHGHIIEGFVQFMSLIKTSERNDTLAFSQTRVKVVPGGGMWRHRNESNM